MEFPNTSREEDVISSDEAFRIIGELRKKYSNHSIRDLDIILNTLCFSLCKLAQLNVGEDDYEKFAELVYKNIIKNLIAKKEK